MARRDAFLTDRRRALLALLGLAAGPALAAPAPAHSSGLAFLASSKGFNLPDQAPQRDAGGVDPATLRRLRQLGMTHVRLPVAAEYVLPRFSGAATIDKTLDDLDDVLTRLLGLGYRVSVDLHPGGDAQRLLGSDSKTAHAALSLGWRGLARRLARYPAQSVFAELLNEPAQSDDLWRPYVERLAGEVRALLPHSTLIVGPAPYQRVDALAQWTPLADANIAYAAHYYDPMAFTHQGANWETGSPWANLSGVPFPAAADDARIVRLADAAERQGQAAAARELRQTARQAWTAAAIRAQFAPLKAWSEAHAATVVVNEFGVLRWKAGRADRLAWIAAVRAAAEASGFGWAHWDYAGSFGLLDAGGSIDPGVVSALFAG